MLKNRITKRAVSLAELIVTVFCMMLLMGVLLSSFSYVNRNESRVSEGSNARRALKLFVKKMKGDLRAASYIFAPSDTNLRLPSDLSGHLYENAVQTEVTDHSGKAEFDVHSMPYLVFAIPENIDTPPSYRVVGIFLTPTGETYQNDSSSVGGREPRVPVVSGDGIHNVLYVEMPGVRLTGTQIIPSDIEVANVFDSPNLTVRQYEISAPPRGLVFHRQKEGRGALCSVNMRVEPNAGPPIAEEYQVYVQSRNL